MKVIVGSPSLVRSGAERIAQAGKELTETGGALAGAAGSITGTWSGPAAVAFGGAAQRTEQACRRTGARLAEVADAGTRYAERLQAAQDELARLSQRELRLGEEELLLRVKAAATAPVGVDQPELAEVAAARARVRAAAEEIVRRHELERAAFEAALTAPPPLGTLGEVAGMPAPDWTFLTTLNDKVGEAKSLVKKTKATVDAFRAQAAIAAIGRQAMPLTEAAAAELAGAEQKLGAASKVFTGRPVPGAETAGLLDRLGVLKTVGGRVNLGMTAWEGFGDLRNGDPEHPGFRDVATRVAGAAGGVGAVVLLASAANPVGMALVTGYGAYKLGTWVYDHRDDIKRVATNAWNRVAPAVAAGRDAVVEKAHEVGRAVGDAVSHAASDAGAAVRDTAAEVGDRIGAGLRALVPRPRFGW